MTAIKNYHFEQYLQLLDHHIDDLSPIIYYSANKENLDYFKQEFKENMIRLNSIQGSQYLQQLKLKLDHELTSLSQTNDATIKPYLDKYNLSIAEIVGEWNYSEDNKLLRVLHHGHITFKEAFEEFTNNDQIIQTTFYNYFRVASLNEALEFINEELLNIPDHSNPGQNPNHISSSTDQKPPLSLAQIALLHVYEQKAINKINAPEIAQKFGHNSAHKLIQHYNNYQRREFRMALPDPYNPKSMRKKLGDFEAILDLVAEPSKVQSELSILRKLYEERNELK